MRRLVVLIMASAVLTLLASTLIERFGSTSEPGWLKYRTGRQPVVGLGDPELARAHYEAWKEKTADPYVVDLVPTDLLDRPERASGWFRIDYDDETLVAEIRGLVEEPVDLWLIDNPAESGTLADPEDSALWVGTFEFYDGVAALVTSVAGITSDKFEIDLAVVTPKGLLPHEGELMYGAPSLFQRLHALEEQLQLEAEQKSQRLLALAAVTFQSGGVPTGFPGVFTDLATEGENLFFNQTFNGNGRTCGTCHFAVDNFTIDTDLISTLPPSDPLFAAETQPPLIFDSPQNRDPITGKPRRFENPDLMRAFGLIVENLDGFGDLENRFTMRGVPHNIGMSVSVTRPSGSIGFPDGPDERTGWSGDGAPFGKFACPTSTTPNILTKGTTRDFALGAVIQHFPRTMNRRFCGPQPDFRLPTDHELDAFGVFFFSLGRQAELNLVSGASDELILSDTRSEDGKVFFRDPEATNNKISCNNCHTNAGANSGIPDNNTNIDTNVEEFIQNRLGDHNFTVVGEPRPIDGGFGLNPDGNFKELKPGKGNGNENFGDGTFNTVSLVESADTAPFFHAHVAFTLEESIEFYASDEFAATQENGVGIVLTTDQRDAVAAFMRAINALDNIENLAKPRAEKAIQALLISNPNANDVVSFLLEVAIADTQDAIDVLEASDINNTGGLPVNAVKQLERAQQRFAQGQNANPPDSTRITRIKEGIQHLDNAVAIIRVNP
jgi:hypothetical protein